MPLQELIYTSVTTLHQGEDKVQAILSTSVRKNEIQSITGLLMFDGQRYIQILEGERDQVERLYEEITKDPRHGQLEMLHTGSITQRAFQTWRMAYEAMPAGLLDQLAENMAVFSLELNGAPLEGTASFGAKLNAMFMDGIAAE